MRQPTRVRHLHLPRHAGTCSSPIWATFPPPPRRPDRPGALSHAGHQRLCARTTTYLGDALDSLRGEGVEVTHEAVSHLTPGAARPNQLLRHLLLPPSTSTPNSAAKAISRCASLHCPDKITKTTRFVRLLSRPFYGRTMITWVRTLPGTAAGYCGRWQSPIAAAGPESILSETDHEVAISCTTSRNACIHPWSIVPFIWYCGLRGKGGICVSPCRQVIEQSSGRVYSESGKRG